MRGLTTDAWPFILSSNELRKVSFLTGASLETPKLKPRS